MRYSLEAIVMEKYQWDETFPMTIYSGDDIFSAKEIFVGVNIISECDIPRKIYPWCQYSMMIIPKEIF